MANAFFSLQVRGTPGGPAESSSIVAATLLFGTPTWAGEATSGRQYTLLQARPRRAFADGNGRPPVSGRARPGRRPHRPANAERDNTAGLQSSSFPRPASPFARACEAACESAGNYRGRRQARRAGRRKRETPDTYRWTKSAAPNGAETRRLPGGLRLPLRQGFTFAREVEAV